MPSPHGSVEPIAIPRRPKSRTSRPPQAAARDLDALVERYHPPLHRALRRLAAEDDRCADLLVSYPAGAVALASRRGPPQARGEALWRVRRGRPLLEVAEALDLAPFLRRAPPEAFRSSVPERLTFAEPSPGLYTQLARRLPRSAGPVRFWMSRLFAAIEHGPPEFALWSCDKSVMEAAGGARRHPMLGAYAFFSNRPDTFAGETIMRPWTPRMSYGRARGATFEWLQRLLFDVALALDGAPEPVVAASRFGAYAVTPLATLGALSTEGEQMGHCIASYWPQVMLGHSLLFGIAARNGERASFEVQRGRDERLRVHQIKGPSNAPPSQHMYLAVHEWVDTVLQPIRRRAFPLRLEVDRDAWERLWAPYWAEFGEQVGPPRRPHRREVAALVCGLWGLTPAE